MKSLKLLRVLYFLAIIFLCWIGYIIYEKGTSTDRGRWFPVSNETLQLTSKYKDPLQGPESGKVVINKKPENKDEHIDKNKDIPIIFAITPTYFRLEQKADITRLCQTLRLVENLHWFLVEDSLNKTALVKGLLNNCKVRYTHLNAVTPPNITNVHGQRKFPRGAAQRNAALSWIREHVDPKETKGTVYFADDDNTYDVRIFEEMRYTNVVSVWPVGLVNGGKFESPLVKDGKVVGWIFVGNEQRRFPIDMASFAINVQLLYSHPKAEFTYSARPCSLESAILEGLNVTMSDMEPKANNCTEILVWHTRTERNNLINMPTLQKKYKTVNWDLEV